MARLGPGGPGPRPRDGLRRAPPRVRQYHAASSLIAAPRPAGPQPRDGLRRACAATPGAFCYDPPVLGHPAFAFLWCSRVLANVAFQMLGVAVGWQLYELTGSALDLGLVGLAQFVPMVLLTLIVGQVADRYDRRLVAATCQIVEAGPPALLVVGPPGGWVGHTGIFPIRSVVGGGPGV